MRSWLLSTMVTSEIKQLFSCDMQTLVRTNKISQARNENNFDIKKAIESEPVLFDMMRHDQVCVDQIVTTEIFFGFTLIMKSHIHLI